MFASGKAAAVASAVNYIEDVFSTYLYTGNGSTQTITNGIDLAGKGGLVWVKGRNETYYHRLASSPGPTLPNYLASNATDAASSGNGNISAFSSSGFTANNNSGTGGTNSSGINYASWTFRKQPKFFDVVTYTGTGSVQNIAHSLGSTPGFIIVKGVDIARFWACYHTSTGATKYLELSATTAATTNSTLWNDTAPTSTQFTVGTATQVNLSGYTYVAYLFAHDAGGFGLTGTDNVISCGSYTGNTTTFPTVTLGYEPQWLLIKRTDAANDWFVLDNMRGLVRGSGGDNSLFPNLAASEDTNATLVGPTATGFVLEAGTANVNANGGNYIYIAIRRGPMKVPTSGTSVFAPVASRSSGLSQSTPIFNAGFPVDWLLTGIKAGGGSYSIPRLTVGQIGTATTDAEASASATYNFGGMLGILSATGDLSNSNVCGWNFRRAPSFFDEVCFTGNGVGGRAITHNLTTTPEMIICKSRSDASYWWTYHSAIGNTAGVALNAVDNAQPGINLWYNTSPTSTQFTVGVLNNESAKTYVAYLFSTTAGVSKVGSYTGTGATQTIACGFTGGARFVLVKRTDDIGDWWVWDTARGMVSGTDPSLKLNTTAAEVNANSIYTTTGGFQIVSTATGINASGGTYIYLAIA